jgi:DNA replication protein DnaC
MFHAQYWGKNIREEMYRWQEKKTGHQPMEIDETNVSPTNFALSFDIEDFDPSGMWIRKDYGLLYDYCTNYFNEPNVKTGDEAPSVVITGQPGVGKWHDFSSYS